MCTSIFFRVKVEFYVKARVSSSPQGEPTFQSIVHLCFSLFQLSVPEEFLCDDVRGDELPRRLPIIFRLGQPALTWENGRL